MRLVIAGILTLIILVMICAFGSRKEINNDKKMDTKATNHHRNPYFMLYDKLSNQGNGFIFTGYIKPENGHYIYN